MNQEYFAVELSASIQLGLPLVDMGTIVQLEHRAGSELSSTDKSGLLM